MTISAQNKIRHNFFSKPHFPRDFMQTVDGNWFHSPNKNAMLVHLGTFPVGFGDLLSWLLLSHLLTVQATPATPPWLLDQTSQGFPSHFTLFLSPPEIICLWQNPQATPWENPVLRYAHWHEGLGKALQRGFHQRWDVHPRHHHSTAVPMRAPSRQHFPQ